MYAFIHNLICINLMFDVRPLILLLFYYVDLVSSRLIDSGFFLSPPKKMYCTALCWKECVAVCCSKCVAVYRNVLSPSVLSLSLVLSCALQCVAVGVLQCIAVC